MCNLASQLKKAFPSYLEEEINAILKKTNIEQIHADYTISTFAVYVNDETIEIPVRHGLNEILQSKLLAGLFNKEIVLTELQQDIVNCFYTRHWDGFKREYFLKKIIRLNHEWVVPYVIQLVGEYVVQITNFIYENISSLDLFLYKEFIEQNPKFYKITQDRVQSYWNIYYRKHGPDFLGSNRFRYSKDEYPGAKILDIFNRVVKKRV